MSDIFERPPLPGDNTYDASIAFLTPGANDLLHTLAWFAPDPIPTSLLENEHAPANARAHLAELEDLALAHRHADGTAFTLPRLLQETARQQQAHLKPPPALTTALEWVNETFPYDSDEVHFWPIAEPLAPHAQSIALHAADRALSSPTAFLLNQVALFYEAKGQHTNAEPLIRRALAMDEASFGPQHPNVATGLNNFVQLLQDSNRLSEAKPLMRRAAVILITFTKETKYPHPSLNTFMNNYGSLLTKMGGQPPKPPGGYRIPAIMRWFDIGSRRDDDECPSGATQFALGKRTCEGWCTGTVDVEIGNFQMDLTGVEEIPIILLGDDRRARRGRAGFRPGQPSVRIVRQRPESVAPGGHDCAAAGLADNRIPAPAPRTKQRGINFTKFFIVGFKGVTCRSNANGYGCNKLNMSPLHARN